MAKKFVSALWIVLWLVFSGFLSNMAWSGVFQCQAQNGVLVYRDRPCLPEEQEREFLAITYAKTDPNRVEVQAKLLKRTAQEQTQHQKKEERLKLRAEKKRAEELLKMARRKKRCQRLDEKILEIEDQMRKPCKPKRMQRLQEQREHCHKMKQRYCESESCL